MIYEKILDGAIAVGAIGILIMIFILPHGFVNNEKMYLYDSSAADFYQRNSVWDTWWTVYSCFASTFSSLLCICLVADIDGNERTPLKIVCAVASVVLHLISMTCMPLVHEMQHTSIIDTASSEHEIHTTIGSGLYIQFSLPFVSYAKHLLL